MPHLPLAKRKQILSKLPTLTFHPIGSRPAKTVMEFSDAQFRYSLEVVEVLETENILVLSFPKIGPIRMETWKEQEARFPKRVLIKMGIWKNQENRPFIRIHTTDGFVDIFLYPAPMHVP